MPSPPSKSFGGTKEFPPLPPIWGGGVGERTNEGEIQAVQSAGPGIAATHSMRGRDVGVVSEQGAH